MSTKERKNRDWIFLLAVNISGIIVMYLVGQFALRLMPDWSVVANMDSGLNPNATFVAYTGGNVIEPVLPEIQTPLSFLFITPSTHVVYAVTPNNTVTPFQGDRPLSTLPQDTKQPTPTLQKLPTPTPVPSDTPTSLPVYPKTPTSPPVPSGTSSPSTPGSPTPKHTPRKP